jgi:cholesterol transport system auxiliary component
MLLGLAGCAAGLRQAEPAQYDLGPAQGGNADIPALRAVDVRAAAWLDSTAMQYRLAYADPARRLSYATSRWAAPPAALLEHWLRQRLLTAAAPPGGCRLQIEIDEFVQVFAGERASRGEIEVRAALLPPRGETPLVRHAFAVGEAAASADARGGVAAQRAAAKALTDKLGAWLARTAADLPAVAAQCGS